MTDDRWDMELLCREIIIPTITRRVRSKCRGLPCEEQKDLIGDSQVKVLRDPRARLLMEAIVHGAIYLKEELGKRVWWLTGKVIAEYFRQIGRTIEARSLEKELAGEEGDSFSLIDTIADEEPDPLSVQLEQIEQGERRERVRRLWELILLLAETQRVVVEMRLFQELPYADISEFLSKWEGKPIEPGALRGRYLAAIRRLIQLYRERYPNDPWLS